MNIGCDFGFGWFTITNATVSQEHPEGTVVWQETGDFGDVLVVYIWVDNNNSTQQVEYLPGEGFALVTSTVVASESMIVEPQSNKPEFIATKQHSLNEDGSGSDAFP